MTTYLRLVFVLLIVTTAAVTAQTAVDFSGVWTPVVTKAASAPSTGGVAALPPSDLTVKQTTEFVALSRTAFDQVTTMTYLLNGHDSTNKSGATTRVTRSRWEKSAIVTEGRVSQVTSQGYDSWTLKETMRLNAQGHLLIESERTGNDGVVSKGTQEYARKR